MIYYYTFIGMRVVHADAVICKAEHGGQPS